MSGNNVKFVVPPRNCGDVSIGKYEILVIGNVLSSAKQYSNSISGSVTSSPKSKPTAKVFVIEVVYIQLSKSSDNKSSENEYLSIFKLLILLYTSSTFSFVAKKFFFLVV